jgi:hypothetical protein
MQAYCAGLKLARPLGGDSAMVKRLVRRVLRRCGIALPFTDVICAEHIKSVAIGADGHAKVTVQEKLVFLEAPEIGDLQDTCSVDAETTFDNFIRNSPDSVEGGRRRIGATTFVMDWMPKSPITRYGLYEHEYSWFPAGSQLQPAVLADYRCERRTGHFLCELITPQAFEAAVVFERPRWPLLNTERRVVRYALKQIEAGGGRPSIVDNGQRIEWRIAEPKIGARFMCVAFHTNGLLLWNDTLQKNSLAGRMRRLVGRFAPG